MSTDAIAAPSTRPPRPATGQIAGAFVLPLFFILMLSATIVTAFHHSKPHDLALTITGPASTVSSVAAGVDRRSPGSFDITQGGGAAAARTAVLRREAVGAIVIGGTADEPTVTTYTADAGGRSAATAVQTLGAQVAAQLGTTATVVGLAPLAAEDPLGVGLFYVFSYSSIAGYLTIVVLAQVLPRARLRTRLLAAAVTAVVVPAIAFGLASIFFAGFGASFGQIVAILGLDGLYVLTVMLIAILATQLLGRASIFGIAPFAIFLNLPSAGGAVPESMLPGFWQAMHSFWFGAGGYEAMRDVLYFPGANPIRWIAQLLLWTLAVLAVVLLVEAVKQIWRLQSIVLKAQHHPDSVSEHLELMSVPRQDAALRQLTAGAPARPTATDQHGPAARVDTDAEDAAAVAPAIR